MTIDQAIEDIAVILSRFNDEEEIRLVAFKAEDMAIRASHGWWLMPGSPELNKQMDRLKKRIRTCSSDGRALA